MAKQIDKTNRLWYETSGKETKVGFTNEFLQQLQECFHIVPGKRRTFVRENGPLMAVETNTSLFSLGSPVRGVVTFFDDKAMNFPEQLTEDDIVCVLSDKQKTTAEAADPVIGGTVAAGTRINRLHVRAAPPAAEQAPMWGLFADEGVAQPQNFAELQPLDQARRLREAVARINADAIRPAEEQ